MTIESAYLTSTRKQFLDYKTQGDKAIAQLSEADLDFQPGENSNSIAIIIQHLHGNMKSRFTNFLTEDGEKPWRHRDEEFISPAGSHPPGELLNKWEEGWELVLKVIDQLSAQQLLSTITIRHEPLLVIDALTRQLAHAASHIGQIVYLAKLIRGKDWVSISIPKGESEQFNQKMAEKFKRD